MGPTGLEADATFQEKSPKLIDHTRAPRNQTVPYPVQSLQFQLIIRLDGHKAHVLTSGSFRNGFCVRIVILVGLHERSDKLCWQTYFMPLLAQGAPEKVRSNTCSIPISDGGRLAAKASNCRRENFFLITTRLRHSVQPDER